MGTPLELVKYNMATGKFEVGAKAMDVLRKVRQFKHGVEWIVPRVHHPLLLDATGQRPNRSCGGMRSCAAG